VEIKGDVDCVTNFDAWKFLAGPAENIARPRIQTAAMGVNRIVKAMRRQTESQPECKSQGDFHHERRGGRQMSFYSLG
jgi:hypothetical protein